MRKHGNYEFGIMAIRTREIAALRKYNGCNPSFKIYEGTFLKTPYQHFAAFSIQFAFFSTLNVFLISYSAIFPSFHCLTGRI